MNEAVNQREERNIIIDRLAMSPHILNSQSRAAYPFCGKVHHSIGQKVTWTTDSIILSSGSA